MEPGAPRSKVWLAFAAVYIIWGSTYYFIREALDGFPPMMLGGLRFVTAAALMLGWCAARGISVHPGRDLRNAAITGVLLLFVGNGVVVWVEQSIPSSVVAIMIAVAPLAFVVLDRPQWSVNFRSWSVLLGIVAGFMGIWLLFSEKIHEQMGSSTLTPEVSGMLLMLLAIVAWPAGSLYAKYHPATIPPAVNTGWQMMIGGLFFMVASTFRGEWSGLNWSRIPMSAWGALAYLMVFGSIIGFSAYVWLLKVRPAAQVSTYAYVNPVVAVLFGVFLGHEHISGRQIAGLVVILGGVLLINITKYRGKLRR
jgi:drug/metabolite transporter (DMT)-like permease